MRILFLNQYFPPDPAPTGVLLAEIAVALQAAGHEVVFVSSGQQYRGGGKKGGPRLLREIKGLCTIFLGALRAGPVEVVVSATSPPLLVMPAALVAKWRGARHLHWLFDMYPEIAVALGEIGDGAMAALLRKATRWACRNAETVVALDADMAARLEQDGVKAEILPPWVLRPLLDAVPTQAPAPASPPVWLYSGNLGRAHEWETLLRAQQLLEAEESPWRLMFQGGGPAWPAALERARELGLQCCEWRPYVPENELPASLLAAQVLVVTQRPEARGLLWPSKLALARSLPRRILWVGPVDSAIAREISGMPHAAIFAPGDAAGIAAWLGKEPLPPPGAFAPEDAAAVRDRGLRTWVRLVNQGVSPSRPR